VGRLAFAWAANGTEGSGRVLIFRAMPDEGDDEKLAVNGRVKRADRRLANLLSIHSIGGRGLVEGCG
jgi:hypothetical protein